MTSLEYKIKQDQKRLTELSERIANEQVRYDDNHNAFMTFAEIDDSGKKSITGKFTVSAADYKKLTTVRKLRDENRYLSDQVWTLKSKISRLKAALSELTEKCKPYLEALKVAPKAVKKFTNGILERFKKQEKSIEYKPIPAPKSNT